MKNFFPSTLSRYLARTYTLYFLALLVVLLGIVYLFDTVELMRRAAKFDDIPIGVVLRMGVFKLPEIGQVILPFAILFSAMLTFWQLTRRHELIIVRSVGLSVWQFLGPVVGVALVIGMLQMTVINPAGAILYKKFESLEATLLDRKKSLISLTGQGLWLRQPQDEGDVILHASNVKMPGWVLRDVTAVFFGPKDTFIRRIDAQTATLEEGQWTFHEAVENKPQSLPRRAETIRLETRLTADEIEDSFAAPETIPFWQLRSFISTMESTGFDSSRLKIHYQSLLAQPLLFAAMILLAASVSLRPPRLRGTSALVMAGIAIGFFVFFMSSFLQALGVSGQIPVFMAAWIPPLASFLLGLSAMMVLEDG